MMLSGHLGMNIKYAEECNNTFGFCLVGSPRIYQEEVQDLKALKGTLRLVLIAQKL